MNVREALPYPPLNDPSMVLDAAFGQEVMTVNEFRQLLGLKPICSGDVTVKGRSIEQAWLKKQGSVQ